MPADEVLRYHGASKHRLDRYAAGPGRLDWANQPEPFRWFTGAETIELPLAADALTTRYRPLRRGRLPAPHALDMPGVAVLFELALGLSAWKSFGASRWALRCNPSSGNLHPTEGYLLCPALPGLRAGVYHYLSRDHVLERRAQPRDPRWDSAFASRGVLVGISSIYWREAWKYGVRAWRYCQHDCGHAIAAIVYAAAALGWQARLVDTVGDRLVAVLLGLDRDVDFAGSEPETPDALLWIGEGDAPQPDAHARALADAAWSGHANRLSASHVHWSEIGAIHRATEKPATAAMLPAYRPPPLPPPADPDGDPVFATLARRRRSAVAFDGETRTDERAFFAMLDALLVRENVAPWSVLATPPRVHLALLVHRVTGLEPGLYVLVRDRAVLAELRSCMRPEWEWEKQGPEHLPLHRLIPRDLRAVANLICCHQDIAADACFALAMLASVGSVRDAPWRYRHLFWECGMLGQALYLEAEAAGLRATGIGCFFDDEMHALLGIGDDRWQSLYHFTVGGPREDPRLATSAPYPSRRAPAGA